MLQIFRITKLTKFKIKKGSNDALKIVQFIITSDILNEYMNYFDLLINLQ